MLGNWSVFPEYLALGALGAASVEWLKTYELRQKIDAERYQRLFTSVLYWAKFLLFILASGFIAWAMTENNPNATVWQVVIAGAGANAFANKGVEAGLSKEKLMAGPETAMQAISFRSLF